MKYLVYLQLVVVIVRGIAWQNQEANSSAVVNGTSSPHEDGKNISLDASPPHNNVTVVTDDFKYINISWITWMPPDQNLSLISNYVIYYTPAGDQLLSGCPFPQGILSKTLIVSNDVTTKVIKSLDPGTTYVICLQANFTSGESLYSEALSYTTQGFGPDNSCNCTITKHVDPMNPCHPVTGHCNCIDKHAEGMQCDRCKPKYFLSSTGCRACQCLHAHSTGRCHTNNGGVKLCECIGDFSGVNCDQCKNGYYQVKNVKSDRWFCKACECNNNTKPGSYVCNNHDGECTNCWYNTTGKNCELCKEGFVGSALNRTCRKLPPPASRPTPTTPGISSNATTNKPVEQTSAFHEISFLMGLCLAVGLILIVATVVVIYYVRKHRGKPFRLWTVKYRDEVSFTRVDQQPDLLLLNDDGVQYFERDGDVSPSGGNRPQLQFNGNQIYNKPRSS